MGSVSIWTMRQSGRVRVQSKEQILPLREPKISSDQALAVHGGGNRRVEPIRNTRKQGAAITQDDRPLRPQQEPDDLGGRGTGRAAAH
ncbi:MAG: hypothetical protein GDA49_09315 [Rhodospirillales bacterium]|nr:hypothetical protein [Rhodospirillales bacterium]